MRFVLTILFCLLNISFFYSCDGFRMKRYTPKEFLNHTEIRKENYSKDSVEIIRQLKSALKRHEDFFDNTAYFGSEILIIDTIIYSPDFSKIATFIMIQTQRDKQRIYDGNCYLGLRQMDTICISSIGPSFSNSHDMKYLSNIMRDSYFTAFATKDTIGLYTYKYNLDDIRFWNCSIWQEIEQRRIKNKIFEEEKKKHPENIYEPKR